MDKEQSTATTKQWPEFMRPMTAAAYLDVSEATIYRWIKQGKLRKPVQVSPKITGWPRKELAEFAESMRGG